MKYTPSVILLSALLAPAGFAAIPTALPSFKSEKQLTTWRADQATKSTTASASESSDFYTGKPYVHSSKGYAFKYRTYSPVESRWTSEDPSGYPDGANQNIYAAVPTSEFDPNGLWTFKLDDDSPTNPSNTTTASVNTYGYIPRSLTATAKINTTGHTDIGGTEDYMTIVADGKLGTDVPHASASVKIEIDDDGVIHFTPQSGSWQNVDGDVTVGAVFNVSNVGKKYTFTYTVQASYEATGLTGAGALGGSLTWTGGKPTPNSFVTVTYIAME